MPSSRASHVLSRLAGVLAVAAAGALPARANWVASWESAPAALSMSSLRMTTVRQFLRLSLGGSQLRVRFSNETGSRTLTIGGAHLSLPGSAPGSIDPASDRALTFGGAPTASVPPGAPILSDPVDLPVAALATVAVTALYDSASPLQVGHLVASDTAYILAGNHTGDANFDGATTLTSRFYLGAVDVSTPGQTSGAVGTLGDSITDGLGSATDRDHRWTDRLAERFVARANGPVRAVVNGGLTSNGVLGGSLLDVAGQSALARLDRDALSQSGVQWLVLFEGINDIASTVPTSAAAPGLIAAYRQIIARAHARGLKVMGATLTPFAGSGQGYYSAEKERARQAVNLWIRNAGEVDGVLDFDAALRDPSKPLTLRSDYDSGDHLHPSDAGYRAMGDSIPLDLFR